MFRGTAGKGPPMRTFALTLLTLCVATLVGRLPLAAQGRSNILTAEGIDQANGRTAYDAVPALRPRWLQAPRALRRQPQKGLDTRAPRIAVYLGHLARGGSGRGAAIERGGGPSRRLRYVAPRPQQLRPRRRQMVGEPREDRRLHFFRRGPPPTPHAFVLAFRTISPDPGTRFDDHHRRL